jgi:transposase
MLTTDQINGRLYWTEHWPIRKIERHLRMNWRTIKKYLDAPAQAPAQRQRESKLDPFKTSIAEWLEKDPSVTAAMIEQKLRTLGYRGGHTILRDYVHTVCPQLKPNRAFLCMEPAPSERFEVDWGHFGVLDYTGDKRKLYAFALVEADSRMLYLEFTHSQTFETYVRCHVHASTALGGVAGEIAYDNLATAVAEHDGRLVRFLQRFLAFAREYAFIRKPAMWRQVGKRLRLHTALLWQMRERFPSRPGMRASFCVWRADRLPAIRISTALCHRSGVPATSLCRASPSLRKPRCRAARLSVVWSAIRGREFFDNGPAGHNAAGY